MATVLLRKNTIWHNFIEEPVLQSQAVAATAPRAHEVPQRFRALERSQMLIAAGLVEPAGPWWPRRLPYAPLPPARGRRTHVRANDGWGGGREVSIFTGGFEIPPNKNYCIKIYIFQIQTICPSGLRRWTQVPLAQAAWVQIPQLSIYRIHCMQCPPGGGF